MAPMSPQLLYKIVSSSDTLPSGTLGEGTFCVTMSPRVFSGPWCYLWTYKSEALSAGSAAAQVSPCAPPAAVSGLQTPSSSGQFPRL